MKSTTNSKKMKKIPAKQTPTKTIPKNKRKRKKTHIDKA